MKRMLCTVLLVGMVMTPIAWGEDLTDPKAIFTKTDEAAKAVKAVKYHGRHETKGGLAAVIRELEGDVTMVEQPGQAGPGKVRIEAQFKALGSEDIRRLRIAFDGTAATVLDDNEKKAYETTNVGRLGPTCRTIFGLLLMAEFTHPTPFSDEINAKKAELKDAVKVGEEDCYHLQVEYNTPQPARATWYVSKKDFLPRQVDRFAPSSEGQDVAQTLIVTNLVIDPQIPDDTFKLTAPEGYTAAEGTSP